ncbi:hypothetical protein D3C86_2068440 [compost metagenome]
MMIIMSGLDLDIPHQRIDNDSNRRPLPNYGLLHIPVAFNNWKLLVLVLIIGGLRVQSILKMRLEPNLEALHIRSDETFFMAYA